MGTRRKRRLVVSGDPNSPIWDHIGKFKDMSGELFRLAEVGLRVERLGGTQTSVVASTPDSPVTSTFASPPSLPPVPVASKKAPDVASTGKGFNPGWDDEP